MSAPDATPKRPEWADKFLKHFRELGMVTPAAKKTGVERSTVYRLRDRDETFAAEWAKVEEWATEELEQVAYKRAVDGSDTLAIFLLKARRPSVYRESVNVKHGGKVGVQVEVEEGVNEAIDGLLAENDRLTERLAELEGAKADA